VLCARAKELEEAGRFEEARLVLGEFGSGLEIGQGSTVLTAPAARKCFCALGFVGWIGSARQISGAQEAAKDLISESSAIFEELGLAEKVAEARVDLGICYWREGALDEARITFDDACYASATSKANSGFVRF